MSEPRNVPDETQDIVGSRHVIHLLAEVNLFWFSLTRIISDFHSDVEQIKLQLQDTVVKMPSEHDVSVAEAASKFEEIFLSMSSKGEDDFAYVKNANGTTSLISKRDLRSITDAGRQILVKNKRNKNFLNIICFNHLVSLFDGAILDFADTLFKKYPFAMVPRDRGATIPTMNYVEILNAVNVEQLQQEIRERELFSFGFKSIREQILFFNKILNADNHLMHKQKSPIAVDDQLIGSIIEIRETRNAHVHNKGIINNQYQTKIQQYFNEVNSRIKDSSKHIRFNNPRLGSPKGYFAPGDFREITEDYINDSIWKLTHLLNSIRTALNEKFISQDEIATLDKQNNDYWMRRQAVVEAVIPSTPASDSDTPHL